MTSLPIFLSTQFQLTSLLKNHKEPLSQLLTASISLCMYTSACKAGDPGSIPGSGSSPGEGIGYPLRCSWTSLVAQIVKNLPAMRETWVCSLGWEDPLEENMQPTLVFLSGESLWTEESGELQSMGSQRVGHDWATKHMYIFASICVPQCCDFWDSCILCVWY